MSSLRLGEKDLDCGRAGVAGRRGDQKEDSVKISARNLLKGRVVDVKRGATTAHVKIEIGPGVVVTASITNEAVDELRLTVGDQAYAVIKASDVMVGKD